MTYTTEEVTTLKENTRQIEQYIRRLMPDLRDSIHIEFGNTVTRRGYYGFPVREREFVLYISKDNLSGGSGGLSIRFTPPTYHTDGVVDMYNDRGFGVPFMASLCENWQKIKSEIHSAIRQQSASVDSIKHFVL